MEERHLRIDLLIHLFALAHAAAAVLSRIFDYVDDIPLTLLTILMIIIISIRRNLQIEVIAALSLSGCFVGYALGNIVGTLIAPLLGNTMAASAIATAIITEMLGWTTFAISQFKTHRPDEQTRYPETKKIVSVAVIIVILRITYMQIFKTPLFDDISIYTEIRRLFSNTFALVFTLGGCIILVNYHNRRRGIHYIIISVLLVVLSLVVSFFAYYDLPWGNDNTMEPAAIARLFLAALPVCITVYAIFLLVGYVATTRTKLLRERDKRHKVSYQYDNLKRQINPHFLFNSLNILEYLVADKELERASAFIRKLAGMYRYMLQNDEKPVVTLGEEIEFAQKYIDLLAERFAEGLSVEFSLSEEALKHYIVPCSLQLLIENATKHNIVSRQQPLSVLVTDINGSTLCVRNNLQPRLSNISSTGVGLKNIRQQYADIAGEDIEVVRTETDFFVKLPLL